MKLLLKYRLLIGLLTLLAIATYANAGQSHYIVNNDTKFRLSSWQMFNGEFQGTLLEKNEGNWIEKSGFPGQPFKNQWYRISIQNNSNENLFLVSHLESISTIILTDQNGNDYYKRDYGTLKNEPDIFNLSYYTIELPLKSGFSYLYYQTYSTRFSQPIFLFDAFNYTYFMLFEVLINWFFIGIAVVVVLHNIFLWVGTGNRTYIIYAGYAFTTCCVMTGLVLTEFTNSSFAFVANFPNLVPVSAYLIHRFSKDLLEASKNFPKSCAWSSQYSFALLFTPALSIFVSPDIFWYLVLFSTLPLLSTIAIWGFAASMKRQAGALAYSIGWLCFLVTILIYIANMFFGSLDSPLNRAPMIGLSLEMLIMTIAIGQKVKFKEASEKLKKVEHEHLQDLVRVLCHDLANPLAVIQSSSEICLIKSKESNQGTWKLVQNESHNMNRLIGRVRFIEAVAAEKINIPIQIVNLNQAIENTLTNLAPVILKKHISLRKKGEFVNEHSILSNQEKISELILEPVLNNALKYSYSSSQIELQISSNLDSVELVIKDFGIGIPSYVKDHLLNGTSFYSTKGTHNETGLGLSLAVAKAAIENIGGSITISSQQGQFTAVHLRFKKPRDEAMAIVA